MKTNKKLNKLVLVMVVLMIMALLVSCKTDATKPSDKVEVVDSLAPSTSEPKGDTIKEQTTKEDPATPTPAETEALAKEKAEYEKNYAEGIALAKEKGVSEEFINYAKELDFRFDKLDDNQWMIKNMPSVVPTPGEVTKQISGDISKLKSITVYADSRMDLRELYGATEVEELHINPRNTKEEKELFKQHSQSYVLLPDLTKFSKLKKLTINRTFLDGSHQYTEFPKSITELSVSIYGGSDDETLFDFFERLPNLELLEINDYTEAPITNLDKLPKLKKLHLSKSPTYLSDEAKEYISANNITLTGYEKPGLSSKGNGITEAINHEATDLSWIPNNAQYDTLDITAGMVVDFSALSKIKVNSLSLGVVPNADFTTFKNDSITYLSIIGTPKNLEGIKDLKVTILQVNNANEEMLKEVAKIKDLNTLIISQPKTKDMSMFKESSIRIYQVYKDEVDITGFPKTAEVKVGQYEYKQK